MLWKRGWYKWPDGRLEMAAMGNSTGTGSKSDAGYVRCNVVVVTDGLGSWLDTLREHIYQNVSEICSNSMDTIAGMMVCVENI